MQRAFTVDEFCRSYKVGRTKAYAEMAAKRLRAAKIGAKTIIRVDDAEAWLADLPDAEGQFAQPELPRMKIK